MRKIKYVKIHFRVVQIMGTHRYFRREWASLAPPSPLGQKGPHLENTVANLGGGGPAPPP